MKRLLVTILAILYLGTSTGATLHLHYCMGKLVDMKLWQSGKERCGNCGMKKSKFCTKKCCKDEFKVIKLDKDHKKAAENIVQLAQEDAVVPALFTEFPKFHAVSVLYELPVGHAPPLKLSIHILNCNFRI